MPGSGGQLPFGTSWTIDNVVVEVVPGAGIDVDNTNPQRPIVSVEAPLRILGEYQFTIEFTPSGAGGLVTDGRWLAAAHGDGANSAEGDNDVRGYPFHIRGNAGNAAFACIAVQTFSAGSAAVDSGTYSWTFELFDDAVGTGLVATILSATAAAQFAFDEGAVTIATGSGIRVFCQGNQLTGSSTEAVIVAFVKVTLYST